MALSRSTFFFPVVVESKAFKLSLFASCATNLENKKMISVNITQVREKLIE
jgi:hypothetical protein